MNGAVITHYIFNRESPLKSMIRLTYASDMRHPIYIYINRNTKHAFFLSPMEANNAGKPPAHINNRTAKNQNKTGGKNNRKPV